MEAKTYIYNQRGQWKAETNVKIEGTDQVLKITTRKDSRKQLVTTASVCVIERGFEVFVMFQDFLKTVALTTPKVVNQKRVEEQQRVALDGLDIILAEVKEFYKKKDAVAA